jgi:hypothetical protein
MRGHVTRRILLPSLVLMFIVATVLVSMALAQGRGLLNVPKDAPKVPSKVKVYVLKQSNVTLDTVAELADTLGLRADATEIKRVGELLIWEQGDVSVQVYQKSGGIWYMDRSRLFKSSPTDHPSFTDAQAQEMATSFLSKIGWMPKDGTAFVQKVRHLKEMAVDNQGAQLDARVIDTEVVFRRSVDGINVEGAGGMIVVYLDNAGSVVGCYKLWREIEGVHQIISTLDPAAAVEAAAKRHAEALNAGISIDIKDLQFGYYEQGPDEAQQFLQPAYVIKSEPRNVAVPSKISVQVFPAGATMFESLEPESLRSQRDQEAPRRKP